MQGWWFCLISYCKLMFKDGRLNNFESFWICIAKWQRKWNEPNSLTTYKKPVILHRTHFCRVISEQIIILFKNLNQKSYMRNDTMPVLDKKTWNESLDKVSCKLNKSIIFRDVNVVMYIIWHTCIFRTIFTRAWALGSNVQQQCDVTVGLSISM